MTGNSQVTFIGNITNCPFCPPVNGEPVWATIVDGEYTIEASPEGGFIRSVLLGGTASAADVAAVAAMLQALSERRSAPTADEVDEALADIDPEIAATVKQVISTLPWSRARRLLAWLLPILLGWSMSRSTDEHVAKTDARVRGLDAKIEQVIEDWEKLESTTTTTSGRVTPKGTVPRASGKPKPRPKRRRHR